MGGEDFGSDYLAGEVKAFIKNLNKSIRSREVYDTQALYEGDFNSLTERYFKASSWPSAETVSPVVDGDNNFLILYKELYFRHIYSKLSPSVDDRLDSFENYVNLFNILIGLGTDEPELELPAVWIWDIIDEFVCQFRSFHNFRTNVPALNNDLSQEEIQALKDNEHHWSAQSVIRYLSTLSKKAGISQLKNDTSSQRPTSTMFQIVGEFSQIGLACVHTLLSDYTSALQALDKIDLSTSGIAPRVLGCYATLFFYMGSSFLMLKRYSDATECFTTFLGHLQRNKGGLVKPHQEELANNMCGLLAICLAMVPESVDDTLQTLLRDKFTDKLEKIQAGDSGLLEEVFYDHCPRFVTPRAPDYDRNESTHQEAAKLQLKMFASEIRQRAKIPDIQAYLKLCTTVTTKKLATFLKTDEDILAGELLAAKHKTKQFKRNTLRASPSSGEWKCNPTQVPFYIAKEIVYVAESKQMDRYAQTMMNNIIKYEDLVDDIRRI